MQPNILLRKIEVFCVLASPLHYPINTTKVRNLLNTYREDEDQTVEYAIVAINDIERKPIWSPDKLDARKKSVTGRKIIRSRYLN